MDYRILGPLEIADGDRTIHLGTGRQRTVLALLLVHRNEVVSIERLIDELWGERPPATAAKMLHNHVFELRRSLAAAGPESGTVNGALQTRGHGYVLLVEPGELDLDRAEAGLEAGRRAVAEGDAELAAEEFAAALALWRGPALPELADTMDARAHIARVEERRLVALEGRVEADLALGRHSELVGELEAAVARDPLRERLRLQLMLALYRAGRRAEALQAYQDATRALATELGLPPGTALRRLERAILDQDPALDPPSDRSRPGRPPPPGPKKVRLAAASAAIVLLLAAAAGAVLQLERGADAEGGLTAVPNSVAAIDPANGRIVSQTPVGQNPGRLAAGSGAVWVLNGDDRTVSRVDAATRQVTRTFATGAVPTAVVAAGGDLWIGAAITPSDLTVTLGPGNRSARAVTRIDGTSGVTEARTNLPRRGDAKAFADGGQRQLAVGEGALWAVTPDGGVTRIDLATNRARTPTRGVDAGSLAIGGGSVWALGPPPYRAATIWQIDPGTGKVVRRIDVPTDGLDGLVFGAGALWATDPTGGNVWRIDVGQPGRRPSMQTVTTAPGVSGIAFEPHGVWVTNLLDDTVARIDPATNRVSRVIQMPGAPRDVAIGEGRVWVTLAGGGSGGAATTSARPGRLAGVRGADCRPVAFPGPRAPDVLVVSDLPLQGLGRADTLPMSQAVALTLKRHGFRAGRFTVGYQSCDDATADAGGSDPLRCRDNARAYAAEQRVAGIIGPFDSPCAGMQIAVANRARAGPLAMVSPSATYPGFTRAGRGSERGDPGKRSPSGQRSFARVIAPEDAHGAAAAVLARDLGLRRIFVVDDGQEYGGWVAAVFRRAARELHVGLVGAARWDGARPAASLLRRARRARPDGVFISVQVFDANGGRLVRALRRTLGPDVVLIGIDGLKPVGLLRKGAGRAADGVYLTSYLIPRSELGRTGREFLLEFERTQPGGSSPYWALYAAAATEMLLAAIARSDGTRASVARELFATRLADGPLGPTAIDRNGDVTPARVPVYRVDAPGARGDPLLPPDLEGATIDRVVTPSRALLRHALKNADVG